MSKSQSEVELEQKAQFFKALGHPMRLLILNLVQLKPRHGEELAAILGLQPATISHHLKQVTEGGVLLAERDL
jgi:DNA-binding transcriptional ArsR family regulator